MDSSKGSVFVQGPFMTRAVQGIFRNHGYDIVETIGNADVVVWTGGEDIDPSIYSHRKLPKTYSNPMRDAADVSLYNMTEIGQLKVGICRGGQLLNCLNGGVLWQHVDKHGGCYHVVKDVVTGGTHTINSLHHQQMLPPPDQKHGAEVVAFTRQSKFKEMGPHTEGWGLGRKWDAAINGKDVGAALAQDQKMWDDVDIEVIWYPHTKSLCFQAHPEMGHRETTDYFFDLVDRYHNAA